MPGQRVAALHGLHSLSTPIYFYLFVVAVTAEYDIRAATRWRCRLCERSSNRAHNGTWNARCRRQFRYPLGIIVRRSSDPARASSSCERRESEYVAPRILYAPECWTLSALGWRLAPLVVLKVRDRKRSVLYTCGWMPFCACQVAAMVSSRTRVSASRGTPCENYAR